MNDVVFNVGAFVHGSPIAPRALVRHMDLLTAYADGELNDEREAYLSHFVFGPEMETHYAANRRSVAGFAGPCWARWLVLDIDRPDLADALADTRRLAAFLQYRYPELISDIPIWFSGSKGFHVLLELAHKPSPAVGFQHTARALAEALAGHAGVRIDTAVYDVAHIIRLPNTRHPRTGLFKRRIDADALFVLDADSIRRRAERAAGDGIPTARDCPAQLAADWEAAEAAVRKRHEVRVAMRRDMGHKPELRAPRYFLDFLRFGVEQGERHMTLFRCAAWLTEQGAPSSLVFALLTEPGCDVGLSPRDVERQIACGIEHARKQRAAMSAADPMPDPADYAVCERWCIQHESDPLPPHAQSFPFGANLDGSCQHEGGRR